MMPPMHPSLFTSSRDKNSCRSFNMARGDVISMIPRSVTAYENEPAIGIGTPLFVTLTYSHALVTLSCRDFACAEFFPLMPDVSSSQKEVERSPPSETSRRIVAVREVFVRNQWLYRGMARLSLRSACSLPYGSRTPARGGYG